MMSKITATMVNELRTKTGVGMMDCKKALTETNGDVNEAIKFLREKGLAKAAKKSERSTNEGRISAITNKDKNEAVILEMNCETDFVAKNDEFISLCNELGKKLLDDSTITSETKIDKLIIDNKPLSEYLSTHIMKLGENISIKKFKKLQSKYISNYIHMNGKIGVCICFSGIVNEELGKDIAMHTAAAAPAYLKPEDVASTEIENEKDIIKKQCIAEGKPEQIIDKIILGRINKYYKEVCLIEQGFIKDDKQAIKDVLPKGVQINSFERFSFN